MTCSHRLDHAHQQALGQPVLAHDPGSQRPAVLTERQLAVARHVQQPVPFHPGHGLADGRPALGQPLGDPGTQRDDPLLFEFEDGTEIHFGRVDKSLGGHLVTPPAVMLCRIGAQSNPAPRHPRRPGRAIQGEIRSMAHPPAALRYLSRSWSRLSRDCQNSISCGSSR